MRDVVLGVVILVLGGSVVIPAVIFGLLGVGERLLADLPARLSRFLRPWWWLGLPLLLVAAMLIYPLIRTIIDAFRQGSSWTLTGNIVWLFSSDMLSTLGNTALWIVILPAATVALALVAATLFDRIKYERLAMTVIVLPTAISFTAGSIVWRQIYSYQPAGSAQLGLLNALITLIPGVSPQPWLQTRYVNSLCLIFVALWAGLGVATLILSAAIKAVPTELIEAASLDGAGQWRIFRIIIMPVIFPAVLVVLTTALIAALRVFDVVYVMTNGNFDSNTLANRLYYEIFSTGNTGHASAIAVFLLILALPVVVLNVRQAQKEAA